MDDLVELNLRLAQHNQGKLDERKREYVSNSTCCIAKLAPSASVLSQFLELQDLAKENTLDVTAMNREYLICARLYAKDIVAGRVEHLVTMHLDWQQAVFLSRLTINEIKMISLYWEGLVFKYTSSDIARLSSIHPKAARYHAASAQLSF